MEEVSGRDLVDLELNDFWKRLCKCYLNGCVLLYDSLAQFPKNQIFVTHLKCLRFNVEAELVGVDS